MPCPMLSTAGTGVPVSFTRGGTITKKPSLRVSTGWAFRCVSTNSRFAAGAGAGGARGGGGGGGRGGAAGAGGGRGGGRGGGGGAGDPGRAGRAARGRSQQ